MMNFQHRLNEVRFIEAREPVTDLEDKLTILGVLKH